MFIWKPQLPEGQTAADSGLPDFMDWVKKWQLGEWHIGWYCLECLNHIWDTRPSLTRAIVANATNLVYPVDPPKRPFVLPDNEAEGYRPAGGGVQLADAKATGRADNLLRARALGAGAYTAPPHAHGPRRESHAQRMA